MLAEIETTLTAFLVEKYVGHMTRRQTLDLSRTVFKRDPEEGHI